MAKMKLRPITHKDIEFLFNIYQEYLNYLGKINYEQIAPTFKEHTKFVKKFLEKKDFHPYKVWYVVEYNGDRIGSFSVKKTNEFGYNIIKKYQGKKLGPKAFDLFFKLHPKKTVWARTNPTNIRSQNLLKKYGFTLTEYEFHFK